MMKKITKWFNKHKPFIKNVCILIAFGRLVYNEPELAYKIIECATGYAMLQFPNFEDSVEKFDV
jgi:hypothetical protein